MTNMENPGILARGLDFLGGCVDWLFLTPPRMARPFKPTRNVSRSDYEKQVDFYFEQGFVAEPSQFFSIDDACPDFRVVEETAYLDGRRQVIAFPSKYRVKNPLIHDQYDSFEANKTGYLVRWIHPQAPRKTVLCLHGYMLGEPDQAHAMFQMEKLYKLGLDLALFIAPFHWRRSAPGKMQRGILLRTDHVGFSCEAMGQSMADLNHCVSILKASGAGDIGLIGASLGAYYAALYSSIADRHAFAAMMVPAVNFSKPYGVPFAKLPFAVDQAFLDKTVKVWELHSPLNHRPKLSTDKMLVVGSRGDRVCSFEYLRELQHKWGFTRYHYMTGGHWLVFNGKVRGRAWYNFLTEMGFIEKKGA